MNLTAFCPYSEAIFDLVKKRLISDGDALERKDKALLFQCESSENCELCIGFSFRLR
jgi:hypothetical protein